MFSSVGCRVEVISDEFYTKIGDRKFGQMHHGGVIIKHMM